LFRAYSHYRAFYGAKHLEYLVANNLTTPTPSKLLDQIYAAGLMSSNQSKKPIDPQSLTGEDVKELATDIMSAFSADALENNNEQDVMLLNKASGVAIASTFEVKEMAVEIERAVEQVQKSLRKKESSSDDTSSNKK
jgi:Tfp pilus assembly ATPase PilU